MIIEKIDWIDAWSDGMEDWKDANNLDFNPPKMVSVGEVTEKGEFLLVAPHFGICSIGTTISGEMHIPILAVKNRTVIYKDEDS